MLENFVFAVFDLQEEEWLDDKATYAIIKKALKQAVKNKKVSKFVALTVENYWEDGHVLAAATFLDNRIKEMEEK